MDESTSSTLFLNLHPLSNMLHITYTWLYSKLLGFISCILSYANHVSLYLALLSSSWRESESWYYRTLWVCACDINSITHSELSSYISLDVTFGQFFLNSICNFPSANLLASPLSGAIKTNHNKIIIFSLCLCQMPGTCL